MKKSLLFFTFMCFAFALSAQKGKLRGVISDAKNGETLIGATAVKKGTTIGAATDFEGNYSLELEPGIHTIEFAYISYATKTVTDIEIKAGEVTLLDIQLSTEVEQIDEVVITAKQIRNTENALISVQKKSGNVMDGISSQTFRKTGDSDAGQALKRVPGVSVQNGKHVFVRGLGDRYTKTIFNSMSIPGLDPDRNAVQVDLFPTNLIDNIIVYKTFSPDLPGDFSGGIVDISTKDFPERKTFSFRYGTSYNPAMNLQSDFLGYEGGATDLLGFDDGTRELPINPLRDIPDPTLLDPLLERMTSSFNPTMAAAKQNNFLNQSFGLSYGNQFEKEKVTLGFNAALNYALNYSYYDNIEFGFYIKQANSANTQLENSEVRRGELGREDALWSALVGGSLKTKNSSFALNIFTTQNATSEASQRIARNFEQTSEDLQEDVLTFTQRSLRNAILTGKHHFEKFDLSWRNSFTLSRVYDPDFRITGIAVGEDTTLNPGAGGRIDRFYRDLNEWNENLRVDLEFPFELKNGEESKIKIGAADSYKERDYEILQYNFKFRNPLQVQIQPDANWFFQPENIWNTATGNGTYLVNSPIDSANVFSARQNIFAAYAMNELPLNRQLKAIYGLRIEKTDMFYTGQDQSGNRLDDIKTLDILTALPSANLVYQIGENTNLRASYNKTLARPSFREKSNAQIFDPISKVTFIGNIDLTETNINNFDLRWETFPNIGEIISVSAFYKTFDGHIEIVAFEQALDNVQPINSGNSIVYGAELEIRKNLNFLSDSTNSFSIGSNISIVNSELDITSVQLPSPGGDAVVDSEYNIRIDNARDGENVSDTRDMAGQAPYLINAYLNYGNSESDINANLSYNVQGKTLSVVGIGRAPDIFLLPFHSLNARVSKNLGKEKRSNLSFSVQNILDAKTQRVFQSFQADDRIASYFEEGRRFGLTYRYTIK
ncbi:MAG: TonB-dependent receptor [Bacteroidota bacterium]